MILQGIINIMASISTLLINFVGGIVDELLFNYLPDVSLLLGYIAGFFNLITQNLNWILDMTGINYDYWYIIFGLYLLRFALIPMAYVWQFIHSMYLLFKL